MATIKSQQSRSLLALAISAFILIFMTIQLRRFYFLGAQAIDLGIFQQGVWLLANGYSPFVTVRGWHLFADHFSPILFVFVPFYRIWAHPFWLFFAQTIALALGTIPVYHLAFRHTGNQRYALLLALAYLLHPAACTMLFFDFHPILLSIPFVLWAIDALDENRPVPFAIASLFALLCREDVAVSVFCLSLYALLVRRKVWGSAIAVVSVLWFLLATKAMAFLSGEERTAYFSLYNRWGNTPLQIVFGILSHPLAALKTLVLCKGHLTQPGAYPMLLLAPLAFLPLFSGTFFLFALPVYAVLALSDWRAMRELGMQHAALIVPFLAASAVFGWRKLVSWLNGEVRRQGQKALAWALGLCMLISFFRFVPHTFQHFHSLALPPEHARKIRGFLAQVIPPDASVSAPSQLVPHLAHRREIYLFPNPFQRAGYGPSAETLKQLDGRLWVKPLPVKTMHKRLQQKPVDYIVLKAGRQNTWPLKPEFYERAAIASLTCPHYGVVAVCDDVVVLKRGENFEAGLVKLGVPIWKFVSAGESKVQADKLEEVVKEAWERLREGMEWSEMMDEHFGRMP
jgi:uncharacterized membrane protein